MLVAVTGSTGLIGRALLDKLEASGHEVLALSRGSRSSAGPAQPAVSWDPASGSIDASGLSDVDAVVHLAGEPIAARRWSPEQKQRIAASRIDGTRLLAEALAGLERPPEVMVSASAIGWYGDRGDEVLDESSDPGTGFLAGVCRDWEAATGPARSAGIRVCHARTGIVLSPSGGALASMLPPFRLGLGGTMGGGRQWMSWITLDDEVSALVWLLTSQVEGPVNLTAPNPVRNQHFTKALASVLRRPAVFPTPRLALYARLGKELAGALLFSSARVLPSALTSAGFRFEHPELAPALRDIL